MQEGTFLKTSILYSFFLLDLDICFSTVSVSTSDVFTFGPKRDIAYPTSDSAINSKDQLSLESEEGEIDPLELRTENPKVTAKRRDWTPRSCWTDSPNSNAIIL